MRSFACEHRNVRNPTKDLVAALQDTCAGYRAIAQPLDCVSGLLRASFLERTTNEPRDALTLWNVRSGDKDGYADPIRMTCNTLKAKFAASPPVGLDRVGCAN